METSTINSDESESIAKAHRLCDALFIFHRYNKNFLGLDDDQTNDLQKAREIINTVDFFALSRSINVEENKQIYHEIKDLDNEIMKHIFKVVDGKDSLELYPIHLASFLGNDEIVQLFLRRYPSCVHDMDSCDNLPLLYAILGGNSGVVRLLIQIYPEAASVYGTRRGPTNRETNREALIFYAVDSKNVEIVRLILKANPEAASERCIKDKLPLHWAAKHGHVEMIKVLLEAYPDGVSDQGGSDRKSPLHFAAASGNKIAVLYLICEYPEAVKCQANKNYLPIHTSVSCGHLEIVKVLLDAYPQGISAKTLDGDLPIHVAAEMGRLNIIMHFIAFFPVFVYRTGNRRQLPIHRAAYHGFFEVVKALLNTDPESAHIKDRSDNLPVHHGAFSGNLEIVQLFLDKNPELLQAKGNCDTSLVSFAVYGRGRQVLEFVLRAFPSGASMKDSRDGFTPLHDAAVCGNVDSLKLLLDMYPLGTFEKDNEGKIPLVHAIEDDKMDAAVLIIDRALSNDTYFGHEYAKDLFVQNNDDGLSSQPLWERRNSIWTKLIDKFGHRVLRQIQALKTFPILLLAIGKVSINEIGFIIDLLDIELTQLKDSKGQTILTTVIKEASKKIEDWERYFKPLLALINSRLNNHNDTANTLSSTGYGIDHNILHAAVINGLPWFGLKDTCDANVDGSLVTPHIKTGLYPFMMASEVASTENLAYKMLRMRPDVIKMVEVSEGREPEDMRADDVRSRKRPRLV